MVNDFIITGATKLNPKKSRKASERIRHCNVFYVQDSNVTSLNFAFHRADVDDVKKLPDTEFGEISHWISGLLLKLQTCSKMQKFQCVD